MKESECESLSKNEQLPESLTLNIPVHHPMGVKIHQAIHNLSQNDSNVYLRKPSRSELASENEKKKKKKKAERGQINKFARSRARQKEREFVVQTSSAKVPPPRYSVAIHSSSPTT